jgi:uroporphyrinogen-III synthase
MSTPRIILTRPIAQAQPLAQRLTDLGYQVTLFPLLEIAPLPEQPWHSTLANLSRYAIAVFVSVNAIHAVFKHGLTWPSEVAIAVMGEGSRAVLAHYGVPANTRVYCPTDALHSDSEALLQELDLSALKGREVLVFRAETGRELLADALLAHGIQVTKVPCYRRFAPVLTEQKQQLLLELLDLSSIWVISSSEALRTLVDMIHKAERLPQMHVWVSHQRIAETAEKCGFKRIRLIGSGDENLVRALQSDSVNLA